MAQTKDQVVKAGKLVWQGENGAIQERILNEGSVIVVGRDPASDIMLAEKLVSKRHALFYWQGDKCVITDQNSANGTLVNGAKISSETELKEGDRIEIGETVFSYYYLGDRLVESLKTMPLTAPDSGAKPPATVHQEESSPPAPAAQPETTRDPQKKTDRQPLIESLPTMIVNATAAESEQGNAAAEPNTAKERKTTMPYPGAASPAPKRTVEASAAGGGDLFATLLEQTQASHASAQAVQNRWLSIRAKLEEIVTRLDKNAPRMSELSEKVGETGLIDLLDKLSNSPTDVNLLVQLGTHSALLSRLIKAYYNQEGVINLINEELQAELQHIGET